MTYKDGDWCHFHQRPRSQCSRIITAALGEAHVDPAVEARYGRKFLEKVNRTGTKGTEHPLERAGRLRRRSHTRRWMDKTLKAIRRARNRRKAKRTR